MTLLLTLAAAISAVPQSAQPLAPASCLPIERGDDGTPIIQASVNGGEPLAFILDTAASGTTIDPSIADRLKLPRDEKTETAHGMGGGIEVHFHRVAMLRAGPLAVSDLAVPALPAPEFESHAVAGLAGIDVFGAKRAVWSPANGCVSIGASGTPLPGGRWRKAAAQWVQPWKIMLPVKIGGVAGWALLDTGAQHTTLNPRFAERLRLDSDALKPGRTITGIDGRELPLSQAQVARVEIGPWRWGTAAVQVGALPVFDRLAMAGDTLAIIGMDWLSARRFAIDYGERSVWLGDDKLRRAF